eukprot:CAMPEP_0185740950 /NCGR_PEP_ID=MMETSP1171-20130828/38694_1 /TAXON_ID=374046 /ORGANISM="Helicotheca tamensis, Strain CCMP826" /LENGTH=661 /DNA_ID=CAMNT_0028412883 /DNA_START=27 /DNA_END=2015 /DNA_ORIENTATION=-
MRNMGLGWIALITVAALRNTSACKNDGDCELNGACSSGACVCDKGWTGTTCGALLLDPNPVIAYGHGSPGANNHSSWGGGPPAYDPATGKYNLFVSEISAHCGMSTWMRMNERGSKLKGKERHEEYYAFGLASTDIVAALRDISACKNDEDCEFNGACSGGACVCDKGWTGTSCGTLLLDPNPVIAYGHGSPGANNHSSWGGGPPVYDPATGKYNLFVSEISAHCGMSTWMRMSQSVRATADTIEGPYEFEEVIIGTESHNTYYAYSEHDDMHLIYTLFAGDSPAYCNPPPPGCRNGITPGGNKMRYKGEWAENTCKTVGRRIAIFYSRSLTGPWERHLVDFSYGSEGRPFNAGTSNPAPYVFPNGTVIMLSRGKDAEIIDGKVVGLHNIWLYRAKSWNATYEWVPSNGENGALKVGGGKPLTEDPDAFKGEWAEDTCKTVGRRIAIFYSRSLTGPWERHLVDFSYGLAGRPFNAGSSNPAPYVFSNGTVIMIGRGKDAEIINGRGVGLHNIWLYRAKSWNATYELVPSNGLNGALKVGGGKPLTEDPTLWRGRRGFHILFHSQPDLTHAWSKDGIIWDWNKMTMGPPFYSDKGGGDNERPRVALDDSGDLDWVFVGQLLPPDNGSSVSDASRTAAFRSLKQSEGGLSARVGVRGGLTSSA